MKSKQMKVRLIMLIALAVILILLSGLYLGLCRGKGFNKVPIDYNKGKEKATEVIEETTIPEEIVPETTPDGKVIETTTEGNISWEKYKPSEKLSGENWALTLINKKYHLSKDYIPETASLFGATNISADTRVAEAFNNMYNAAKESEIILMPISGYCSYNRQKTMFDSKVQAFTLQGMTQSEATEAAQQRIEPAGSSESGAGLSVDIVSASAGFANTDEYKWLQENAHTYGFVLRYPEDKTEKTGIIFQPWHWRYVGVEAATEMKEKNLCLEEYLEAE